MDSAERAQIAEAQLSASSRIGGFWRAVALLAIGAVVGMAPSHITLLWKASTALTVEQVDAEVTKMNAPMIQQITDMKSEVDSKLADMNSKMDDIAAAVGQRGSRHQ